jgi:hypothetical protein
MSFQILRYPQPNGLRHLGTPFKQWQDTVIGLRPKMWKIDDDCHKDKRENVGEAEDNCIMKTS